jgi:NAD(P)-dependent dehydrogenase (short-subunit alcohol dehydrogenase family)
MQQTILITGSNRGLGLEWARQYAESGWRVHATCRYPDDAEELQQIARTHANLTLHQLDVTDDGDLRSLATELSGASIDVLLNNAGVYLEKYKPGFGLIDYGDWLQTLTVNTLGAVRVTEALVEQVARSRRRLVVAITSHMGSIAEITAPGSYYYRSSKAALNAAMKGLSIELAGRGIGVLMLHPGWVRTRMGGPEGLLTPEQSVRGMRRLVEQFALTDNGRFYRYDGSEIPW